MTGVLPRIRERLERLRGEPAPTDSPWGLLRRHTAAVDDLIGELYRAVGAGEENGGMSLVAVGGYGRKELTPWSDIDLMFLCRETGSHAPVQPIYRILHALWDLHLEVGHSVRTIQDCVEVAHRDVRTWTALMDARLVAGEGDLFASFQQKMRETLVRAERDAFIKLLIQGLRERHRNYSRTPFLVEPHLKEGPGGIRDLQSALWLARCLFPVHELEELVDHALISREEAEEISEARAFLWRVRLELHRLAGRKEDHLTFAMQERLSQDLPMDSEGSALQVEVFMRHFYRHATKIHYFVEDIIQKATDPSLASGPKGPTLLPEELGEEFLVTRGRLTLLDDLAFKMDPPKMMEAISFTHQNGLGMDIFTRDEIKASVPLVDAEFRKSRRVRDAFLSLLDTPDCGHGALELMHRLGLLQAYIPEFNRICFQVQHDAYHAYTVDVHSLETVGEMARIRQGKSQEGNEIGGQASKEITRWPPLVLASLLHDVGKGEGSGHAARGSKMVEGLLMRWRLPSKDKEHVVFLVREHLLLMDTSLGRDLTDEKVIADFSRTVASVDRLNDLYLLTLADLRATGPDLLTSWKNQLIRELYLKARHLLETGELVSPEASKKIGLAKTQVLEGLRDVIEGGELEKWVQSLPGRYLMSTPLEDLVDQVRMARSMVLAGDVLRIHHRSREAHQEVVVCTRDAPALFSKICGVLVAHGFNIMAARIHTWTNGIVMDTFQVEAVGGEAPMDPGQLEGMSKDLAAVLEGKEDLDRLLARRAPSPLMKRDRHPAMKPRVIIDNRSSDFYTIVEIRARDRFGLLFAITRTLASLEMDIHLALIDTRRGQVLDVFYVQESTGQKVWDSDRFALLEREIHRALERIEASELWEVGNSGA